jgi:hypothetical protein
MHKTDKEALLGLSVLIGAVVLFSATLWFHNMIVA